MARPKNDVERINVYLPRQVLAIAKKLAKLRGSSYSELIRTAVREYVIREVKREREGR